MIEDLSGIEHEVRFDYATEVKAQISLTVQTNSSFPMDGEIQIKNYRIYRRIRYREYLLVRIVYGTRYYPLLTNWKCL